VPDLASLLSSFNKTNPSDLHDEAVASVIVAIDIMEESREAHLMAKREMGRCSG
jgi:hypothetical protein